MSSGWDQRYDLTPKVQFDPETLYADRSAVTLLAVLFVTVGVFGTVLLGNHSSGEPSYRPLVCTYPQDGGL